MTPFDRARALVGGGALRGAPRRARGVHAQAAPRDERRPRHRGPAVEPALAHARVQPRQAPAAAADPRAPHAGAGARPPVRARRQRAARDAGRAARRSALRVLARPGASVRGAMRFGESLRRVFGEGGAEGSPLLRGRSMSWRFSAFDVEFAELRAASKAVGGSRQRRVPRCAARRLPPLPRGARAADRADADRGPDLRARRGRRRRRQPDRRGVAGGAGGDRRPGRADGRDRRS